MNIFILNYFMLEFFNILIKFNSGLGSWDMGWGWGRRRLEMPVGVRSERLG